LDINAVCTGLIGINVDKVCHEPIVAGPGGGWDCPCAIGAKVASKVIAVITPMYLAEVARSFAVLLLLTIPVSRRDGAL
jgi:hypothetical protein